MKKTISASFNEEFLQRVKAEAEKEKRSISLMIEILASEALDARDKAAKQPPIFFALRQTAFAVLSSFQRPPNDTAQENLLRQGEPPRDVPYKAG